MVLGFSRAHMPSPKLRVVHHYAVVDAPKPTLLHACNCATTHKCCAALLDKHHQTVNQVPTVVLGFRVLLLLWLAASRPDLVLVQSFVTVAWVTSCICTAFSFKDHVHIRLHMPTCMNGMSMSRKVAG